MDRAACRYRRIKLLEVSQAAEYRRFDRSCLKFVPVIGSGKRPLTPPIANVPTPEEKIEIAASIGAQGLRKSLRQDWSLTATE